MIHAVQPKSGPTSVHEAEHEVEHFRCDVVEGDDASPRLYHVVTEHRLEIRRHRAQNHLQQLLH